MAKTLGHTQLKTSQRYAHLSNETMLAAVGAGVWELRIDWGPGYRVYCAMEGKRVVLLCDGGDKRTQSSDIERAISRWNEWQKRSKK